MTNRTFMLKRVLALALSCCTISTAALAQTPLRIEQIKVAAATKADEFSLLDDGNPSVDPFASNDASAVIARPSLARMLDAAVDFNNKEGTLSLRVNPVMLVNPYPDWYVSGLALTAASNTDEKNFSIGGKWDFNFRDPRFAYGWYVDEVLAAIEKRGDEDCRGLTGPELNTCLGRSMDKTVDETFLKPLEQAPPIALSLGGNATYDNEGHFGGGNFTLAFDAKETWPNAVLSKYPLTLSATANAKYADAPPSDEEKDQLEKAGVTPGDNDRGQKAGGGLEISVAAALGGGKDGNERSLELGLGAAALACLDGVCEKLDNGSSVKVNPYLAVAITKSIGGRIDLVWDGTGHTLGDAFAGASLKYAFRQPPEAPSAPAN